MNKKSLYGFSALVAIPAIAAPLLTGKILKPDGTPMAGITVQLKSTLDQAVTDAQGVFNLGTEQSSSSVVVSSSTLSSSSGISSALSSSNVLSSAVSSSVAISSSTLSSSSAISSAILSSSSLSSAALSSAVAISSSVTPISSSQVSSAQVSSSSIPLSSQISSSTVLSSSSVYTPILMHAAPNLIQNGPELVFNLDNPSYCALILLDAQGRILAQMPAQMRVGEVKFQVGQRAGVNYLVLRIGTQKYTYRLINGILQNTSPSFALPQSEFSALGLAQSDSLYVINNGKKFAVYVPANTATLADIYAVDRTFAGAYSGVTPTTLKLSLLASQVNTQVYNLTFSAGNYSYNTWSEWMPSLLWTASVEGFDAVSSTMGKVTSAQFADSTSLVNFPALVLQGKKTVQLSLSGTLKDQNGVGLAGIKVRLEPLGSEVTTGSTGTWSLSGPFVTYADTSLTKALVYKSSNIKIDSQVIGGFTGVNDYQVLAMPISGKVLADSLSRGLLVNKVFTRLTLGTRTDTTDWPMTYTASTGAYSGKVYAPNPTNSVNFKVRTRVLDQNARVAGTSRDSTFNAFYASLAFKDFRLGNALPFIQFTGPDTVAPGYPATFQATSADNDPLPAIEWDVQGVNKPAGGPTSEVSWLQSGTYKVTASVLDADGNVASFVKNMVVANKNSQIDGIKDTTTSRDSVIYQIQVGDPDGFSKAFWTYGNMSGEQNTDGLMLIRLPSGFKAGNDRNTLNVGVVDVMGDTTFKDAKVNYTATASTIYNLSDLTTVQDSINLKIWAKDSVGVAKFLWRISGSNGSASGSANGTNQSINTDTLSVKIPSHFASPTDLNYLYIRVVDSRGDTTLQNVAVNWSNRKTYYKIELQGAVTDSANVLFTPEDPSVITKMTWTLLGSSNGQFGGAPVQFRIPGAGACTDLNVNVIDKWNDTTKVVQKLCANAPDQLTPILTDSLRYDFVDVRDGQYYSSVKIGDQTWMAENLNYLPAGKDKNGAWCYYDNVSNCSIYGRLYDWATLMVDQSSGVQGICPSGWHVPSKIEWEELITNLGGGNLAADKLWSFSWGKGSNSSGFSGLPGGTYGGGIIGGFGSDAYFWSSTELSITYAYKIILSGGVGTSTDEKKYGKSLRCIKD